MKIIDCVQGTPEWHQARCGVVTASEFSSVMAKGQGKTRKRYMYKLLAERISGQPLLNNFQTAAILRGTETEAQARANYEFNKMVDVKEVGFVLLNENIGASPDGLIDDDGGCEIKCPDSHTHIEYLIDDRIPPTYAAQIQGNIWICEREWWDFISYDDRVKSKEIFVKRTKRHEKYISNMKEEVYRFVDELLLLENKLRGDTEKMLRDSLK